MDNIDRYVSSDDARARSDAKKGEAKEKPAKNRVSFNLPPQESEKRESSRRLDLSYPRNIYSGRPTRGEERHHTPPPSQSPSPPQHRGRLPPTSTIRHGSHTLRRSHLDDRSRSPRRHSSSYRRLSRSPRRHSSSYRHRSRSPRREHRSPRRERPTVKRDDSAPALAQIPAVSDSFDEGPSQSSLGSAPAAVAPSSAEEDYPDSRSQLPTYGKEDVALGLRHRHYFLKVPPFLPPFIGSFGGFDKPGNAAELLCFKDGLLDTFSTTWIENYLQASGPSDITNGRLTVFPPVMLRSFGNLVVRKRSPSTFTLEHISDQPAAAVHQRPSINTFGPGCFAKWLEPFLTYEHMNELRYYRSALPPVNPEFTNVDPSDVLRPARPRDLGPQVEQTKRYDWEGMFQPLRDEHCPCYNHSCQYTGNRGFECAYQKKTCVQRFCGHDEFTKFVHIGGQCGYERDGKPCPMGARCKFIHSPMNRLKGMEHRFFHHRLLDTRVSG